MLLCRLVVQHRLTRLCNGVLVRGAESPIWCASPSVPSIVPPLCCKARRADGEAARGDMPCAALEPYVTGRLTE